MRRRFRFFTKFYRRWRQRLRRLRGQRSRGYRHPGARDIEKWREEQPLVKTDYLQYKWEVYSRPNTAWIPTEGSCSCHGNTICKSHDQSRDLPPAKSYYYKFGVKHEIDLPAHIKPHHHYNGCTCMGSPKRSKPKRKTYKLKLRISSREQKSRRQTDQDNLQPDDSQSRMQSMSESSKKPKSPNRSSTRDQFSRSEGNTSQGLQSPESGKAFLLEKYVQSPKSSQKYETSSHRHSKNTRQHKTNSHHGCSNPECSCQVVREYSAKKEAERRRRQQELWEQRKSQWSSQSDYHPYGRNYVPLEDSPSTGDRTEHSKQTPEKYERIYFGRSFSYHEKGKSKEKVQSKKDKEKTKSSSGQYSSVDKDNKRHGRSQSVPCDAPIDYHEDSRKACDTVVQSSKEAEQNTRKHPREKSLVVHHADGRQACDVISQYTKELDQNTRKLVDGRSPEQRQPQNNDAVAGKSKKKSSKRMSTQSTSALERRSSSKKKNRSVSVPEVHSVLGCKIDGCPCRVVEEYSREMDRKMEENKTKLLRSFAKDNEANLRKENDSEEKESSNDEKTQNDIELSSKDKGKPFYQRLFRKKSDTDNLVKPKKKKHIPVLFERRPDAERTRYNRTLREQHEKLRRSVSENKHDECGISTKHSPCSCQVVKEYSRKMDKEYIEKWTKEVSEATKEGTEHLNVDDNRTARGVNSQKHVDEEMAKEARARRKLRRLNSAPGGRSIRKSLSAEFPDDPNVDITIHTGYRRVKKVEDNNTQTPSECNAQAKFNESDVFLDTANQVTLASQDTGQLDNMNGDVVVNSTPERNDSDNVFIDWNKEVWSEYPDLDVKDWDPVKKTAEIQDTSDNNVFQYQATSGQETWRPIASQSSNQKWVNLDDETVDWTTFQTRPASAQNVLSTHGHVGNRDNVYTVNEMLAPNEWVPVKIEHPGEDEEYDKLDVKDWDPIKEHIHNSDNDASNNDSTVENVKDSYHFPTISSTNSLTAAEIYTQYAKQFQNDSDSKDDYEEPPETVYLPPEEWTPIKPLENLYPAAESSVDEVPIAQSNILRSSNISRDSGCYSMSSPTDTALSSSVMEYSIPEHTPVAEFPQTSMETPNIGLSHHHHDSQQPEVLTKAKGSPKKDSYNEYNENSLNEMSVVRKVKTKKPKSKKKSWTSLGAKVGLAKYEELHEVPVDHSELYDEWDKLKLEEEIDATQVTNW